MAIESDFTLRLHGTGKDGQPVRPGSVDIRDLIAFLSNWEKALESTAEANKIALPRRDDMPILSLVEIKDSSYGLGFKILDRAVILMGIISTALANDQTDNLPPKAIEALAAISSQAEVRGWAVQIVPGTSSVIRGAEISAANPIRVEESSEIEGSMTLVGHLLRVGGAKPRAEVRDNYGEIHYIDVDAAQALKLAPHLYNDITLEGVATWDCTTWRVVKFRLDDIVETALPDIEVAFEELRRRVGGAWDGVDVEAYFKAERDENG